jgi:aminoglycoside phosphotransferase (APT) family kinase protein
VRPLVQLPESSTTSHRPGTYPRHNWLPAVVPVSARRFRVTDAKLAATLKNAGAELVDEQPDIEIGPDVDLRGDAQQAVVPLETFVPEGGGRLIRAVRRATGFARVRIRGTAARRAVVEKGYRPATAISWEWEQAIRLPGMRPRPPATLAERLPLGLLVVGGEAAGPTLLQSAIADASPSAAGALEPSWPLVRQSGLVVLGEGGVLRVAVGPGGRELALARAALEALQAASPPPVVAERIPWLVAEGAVGLARWSLEQRLPGRVAPAELSKNVLADCVEFLAALHAAGCGDDGTDSFAHHAAVVAAVIDERGRRALNVLADRLDEALADLPRGFGHGDFWTHNLLIGDDRLVGVVDWHSAGTKRLPVVDLLHLRLSAIFQRRRQYLGTALVEHLLPWARRGGDELVRAYCERTSVEVTPARLEDLALAYWLGRTARELELYADRAERPVWLRHNVELVVHELDRRGT